MALTLELTNLMELQRTSLQALFEAYEVAFRESIQKASDLFKEGLKATLCKILLKVFDVEISPFVEEADQDSILLEESLLEKGRKTAKAELEVDVLGQYGLEEFLSRSMDLPARGIQTGKSFQTDFEIATLFFKLFC